MQQDSPDVPPHLRRFVVEQDYDEYNAVDQAVWRFVMLQTRARLLETAHPAYREGLFATGISLDRIPRIPEMNQKLGRFGWGAVCVDGFIPPRAFQEFQARGILPIAADIRTREHLVYTPAPDIIHEAAGHAPILTDPGYAAYLRGVGELGQLAFTLPEEERIYQAIYTLSEVKENPALGASEAAQAEAELAAALTSVAEVSEATRTSRLYWWTAEYGLVGSVDDYRLYGAGLLSSLWESHSCHDAAVRKLPLDERCTEVAYDITQPQPQLYVTPSFDALHEVLARVKKTMAVSTGGRVALERAHASQEVASARFASGAWAIGVLSDYGPSAETPAFLAFSGPGAFADRDGRLLASHGPADHPDGFVVLTGPLDDGAALHHLDERGLRARVGSSNDRVKLTFQSGACVEARLEHCVFDPNGALLVAELSDANLRIPGRPGLSLRRYSLLGADRFVTAQAGAVDARFHPDTPAPGVRVPRSRSFSRTERQLLGLYERAERAHHGGDASVRAEFPAIQDALDRGYPTEWLLRWNLLESLLKLGVRGALTERLETELERLEVLFERRQPIASGLGYLRRTHPR